MWWGFGSGWRLQAGGPSRDTWRWWSCTQRCCRVAAVRPGWWVWWSSSCSVSGLCTRKGSRSGPFPHVKGLEFYIESLKTIILPRSCITGRVEPRRWTGWSCSCRRWQHRPKYGWVTRAPLEFCPWQHLDSNCLIGCAGPAAQTGSCQVATVPLFLARLLARFPPAKLWPALASRSVGAAPQLQNGFLAEVARLEKALEDVRRDVSLSGCRDGCRQLDGIQQMVRRQTFESFWKPWIHP